MPDSWIDLTTEIYGLDYTPVTPAGPATFPVTLTPAVDDFSASALVVNTPENCSRLVNGMTIALTSTAENPIDLETGIGSSATLALDADFEFVYDGDGTADDTPGYVIIEFPDDEVEQSGTLTITLDEPIPASEAYAAVGMDYSPEATLTVDAATFSVTDDCVAPVPAAPALAATGTDIAPVFGAGAALLLLGGAATAMALRRRTV